MFVLHSPLTKPVLRLIKAYNVALIVVISQNNTQRTLGGGGQGRPYAFLNVVYSDGNEIVAHVQRTSMTKNPLFRNSLLVQKLVT